MFFYLKRYFTLLVFCTGTLISVGQQNPLLKQKTIAFQKQINELTPKKNKSHKRGLGNLLLNIYQKHISVQISADCLYSLSCSRYSREIVNKKGLVLGVLLSADRLTRCSGFCAKDIPERKYNEDGFVEDNP